MESIKRSELQALYNYGGHDHVLKALADRVPDRELYKVTTGWLEGGTTVKARGVEGDLLLNVTDGPVTTELHLDSAEASRVLGILGGALLDQQPDNAASIHEITNHARLAMVVARLDRQITETFGLQN